MKEKETDYKSTGYIRPALIIVIVINLLIFSASIALIVINLTITNRNNTSCSNDVVTIKQSILLGDRIRYDTDTKNFDLYSPNNKGKSILKGKIGLQVDNKYLSKIDVSYTDSGSVETKFISTLPSYVSVDQSLKITTEVENSNGYEITCNHYDWKFDNQIDSNFQKFEDCFSLGNANWYGGAESYIQQFWPINNQTYQPYKPYLTGLFGTSSAVMERYWLSSNGVAIIINQSIPLFVSMNTSNICFLASSKYPYSDKQIIKLSYEICNIKYDTGDQNYLQTLHLAMINKYFSKPSGLPDDLMLRRPIWSTWATFKKDISDSIIIKFANDILANNYSHCQIEIDDKWQTRYGDFDFDKAKFPNMTQFIGQLNNLGFRTTLWVHPFANVDSKNFLNTDHISYWVKVPGPGLPSLTSWWDGPLAGILDTTNPNATEWFVSELKNVQDTYGINSFKFDAGEAEWLPKAFQLDSYKTGPDDYSINYARMAARVGNMIEVRTGCQTQDLPIFVRMLDKDSRWGLDNGLQSVLTSALLMSITGYPFILPDMIGGNAYAASNSSDSFGDINVTIYPDYELFVRWAELTAFMPSMQFSIPPWHYNNLTNVSVNAICKKWVDFHESDVYPQIVKYANEAVQTGAPIIRPMWWADSSDAQNLVINDQFLVGDYFLVAPILIQGATQRDIYIPKGNWLDGNSNKQYTGPTWIRNYPAPIEIIPFFIAV